MIKQGWMQLAMAMTLTVSFILGGCGGSAVKENTKTETQAVTVNQMINGTVRQVTFEQKPQRVVSLSQFSTELLLALGLKDQIVGTAFLEEPISPKVKNEYSGLPVLAEKWPSLEVFLQAKPDFAIGWEVAFSKKGVEADQILGKGVKIFVPKSTTDKDATMDTLFEDINTLGRIFRIEEQAQRYVTQEKERLNGVKAKMKNLEQHTVFIYDSGDEEPFTVYQGFTSQLLSQIGLKNIMQDKGVQKTWGKANWEDILAADPDYILIVEYEVANRGQSDYNSKVQYLKDNPRLKGLKAVRNNAFLKVGLAEIVPGIRNVDLLERLAGTLSK